MMRQSDLEAARDGTDGSGESWSSPTSQGAQQPLDGYTSNAAGTDSEWRQLVTKNTDGIAAKAKLSNSCVIGFHGDTHYSNNRTIVKAPDASNVALNMQQFSTGAIGNQMHDLHPTIVPGYSYDGVTMDYIDPDAMRPKGQQVIKSTCLRVDVTWSGCLWKMTVNTVYVADPVSAPTVATILKSKLVRKNTASCC